MQEVKIKKKLDRTIITHKIGKNEQINTCELDILKKNEISELLPVSLVTNMFGAQLQFEVTNCIELKQYLKQKLSFVKFLDLVLSIVHVVSECEGHAIRKSNLELSSDLIFYDVQKKEVKMVYWPLISLSEYIEVEKFFRQMGEHYPCQEGSIESRGKKEYLQLFSDRVSFHLFIFKKSLEAIRRRYQTEYGEDSEKITKYSQSSVDSSKSNLNLWSCEKEDSPVDIEYVGHKTYEHQSVEKTHPNPDVGISNLDSTLSILWNDAAKPMTDDPNKTVLMCNPLLYRISTDTRIELDQLPFAVGRDPEMYGYVVEGNPYVGRRHAIFTQRGGEYYIKDNNSTNGVKLNGVSVPSGAEEKLVSGYEIELGNEKFVFSLAEIH